MSTPFMQLYVADYLGDTQHLSTEQHGAYLLLLMAMWRAGGMLPDDDVKLARMVRLSPARWRKVRPEIITLFDSEDGQISQKRLRAEYEKAQEKSQKRADAGKAGGKAKALKDNKSRLANARVLPRHSLEPEPEPEVSKIDLTSFGLAPSAACAAAHAAGSEFIRLPTNRFEKFGEEVIIFEGKIIEFGEIYPAIDIRAQIRAMKGWLLNNRDKRKTRSGMMRFVNGWLSKEQNRAGNGGKQTNRGSSARGNFNAAALALLNEFDSGGESQGDEIRADDDAHAAGPALLPPRVHGRAS
jgi:uncharacterized protein YdaU (DUF1376 family)